MNYIFVALLVLICNRAMAQRRTVAADKESTYTEPPIVEIDREHWSYRTLKRPPVPQTSPTAWARNPIDQFILDVLTENNIQPAPEATRRDLIRRLSFDLRGLPPSPERVRQFTTDLRPDAWERLVDEYLADDSYGVRWGQHWLDLARFAETDGFEHDKIRNRAWRYRDWVIEALQEDMPYDRFLSLQLAGDELEPDNPKAHIATGFLLCGPDMPDINLAEERKHNVLNDMTSTVGSVFMAMQLGCAQCHDHKFDPISQADFYRLRAFFESADFFKEHGLPSRELKERRAVFEAEKARRWIELTTAIKQLEEQADFRGVGSRRSDEDLKSIRAGLLEAEWTKYERLSSELARLKKQTGPEPELARTLLETSSAVKESYLRIRGDFRRKGPQLGANVPRVIDLSGFVAVTQPAGATTGQRTRLAEWLTDPRNPATSRVLVNRIWQFHFGHGLTRSESDFGIMGEAPSHPELLDWLATEFTRQSWSIKTLHRLILTSATYRQASHLEETATASVKKNWHEAQAVDPDHVLLSRFPRRRLDGESLRDSVLAVAGLLSPRRTGQGVRPPLPPELVSTLLRNQWPVSPDKRDHDRRSIYLFVRRNLRFPIFDAFDKPDTNASCARRNVSTTAPQALFLYNSSDTLRAARALARKTRTSDDLSETITRAFELTLSRFPTPQELNDAIEFIGDSTESTANSAGTPPGRLELFCLTLLNLNEFLYVD